MQTMKELNSVVGYKINMCKISLFEGHVTSVTFCPQTYSPSLVVRKKYQTQNEGHSAKCLTSTPPNCHGHKKEILENCHKPEETKDT